MELRLDIAEDVSLMEPEGEQWDRERGRTTKIGGEKRR